MIESRDERRDIDIYAPSGAPVVAVNDGVVKEIGRSRKLGRYVELQDVYGNRFTYAHLGEVAEHYPVPKEDVIRPKRVTTRRGQAHRQAHQARLGRAPAVAERGAPRRRSP